MATSGHRNARPPPSEQRRPVTGRLIIIGGHEEKEQDTDRVILRHVANCSRGGLVVVCTVASDVPQELWKTYEQTSRGLGGAAVVDIERRADLLVDPPPSGAALAGCWRRWRRIRASSALRERGVRPRRWRPAPPRA